MKNNYGGYCLLVFILLMLSGCFLFPSTATIRVENNTSDILNAIVTINGGSSDSFGIPTSHSSEEYEIKIDSDADSVSVELSISGPLKLVEQFSFELSANEVELISIEPDAGALAFDNYGFENLLWVWLVSEDPTSYTSRTKVENDASYAIENLGPNEYTTITCSPGTYYVVIQTDGGYYYQTEAVVVEIDKHGHVDCDLTYSHPSL